MGDCKIIEQELFQWEEWDEFDTGIFCFMECVLVVDIGEYKAGTRFASIVVDWQKATLTFQNNTPNYRVVEKAVYSLHYRVGDKLS